MLSLAQIQFPIYLVPKQTRVLNNEVVAFCRGRYSLIYDKNIGKSLSKNRLAYASSDSIIGKKSLYKFKVALFHPQDLFIHKAKYRTFIDSAGKLFTYTPKSIKATLEYYKVQKYREVSVGYVVFLHGIPQRFLINRPPALGDAYAGVLRVGRGYVLYELCDSKKPTTWRAI
jgi:hypothetical protein